MSKAVNTNVDNIGYFNPPNVYKPAILSIDIVGEYNPNDGAFNTYRITQNDGRIYDIRVKNGSGGSTGRGIADIDETPSTESSGINIIRVTYTDGTHEDFQVRNGAKGDQGIQGIPGPAGIDSVTTAVEDPEYSEDGPEVVVGQIEDGVLPMTFKHIQGPQGVSIESVEQTTKSLDNGGTNVVTITLENGDSETVEIKNGESSAGFFATSALLEAAHPSPVVGDYAFVSKAGDGTFPAYIYVCSTAGTWTNSTEEFTTEVPQVTVSQNTSTGHTDINIGTDSYPVPSVEEVSQLGQKVTNIEGKLGDSLYKDISINYGWKAGVINTDGSTTDYPGSEYRYSALIPITGESINIRAFSGGGTTKAFVFYAQDESVVDASETGYTKGGTSIIEVSIPNNAYYIRLQTERPSLSTDLAGIYLEPYLSNKATIKKFAESAGRLKWNDKTIMISDDLQIGVLSNNIAAPGGIIVGKLIDNNGDIVTNAEWAMYILPVTPGQIITFGGFYLGRYGYCAFYNDNTLVSFTPFNDPDGVDSPVTVTVPSGVNRLYFDIKSGDSPSDPYDYLQINKGSELLPYDEYKEGVVKILGYDLASNGNTQETIPDLIADLPLSADGAGITEGYAYINSTTGVVTVKI